MLVPSADEGFDGEEPPIRLLHVLEATIGGTKRHLLDLLRESVRRDDLSVEVACPSVRDENHGDTTFVSDALALGVRIHEMPMRRSIHVQSDVDCIIRLAAVIRRGAYDLVHLHSSKAGALGRAAAWLAFLDCPSRRPKVVYSPHGFAFLIPGSRAKAGFYAGVERVLGNLTACLIAISEDERQEAIRRSIVPRRRSRVVRNGLDPNTLPDPDVGQAKRHELGWGPRGSSIVIGTVARMTLQKDPFTWLRAAGLASERRPDLRFVWVMGGELEHEVHALARALGLQDGRLHFYKHRSDAREVMAAMDVFVLSSVFEAGLPYVLMEAMVMQTPVVATACTGSRELIRDGVDGYLVAPGDAQGLADRMLHLAESEDERRRMGHSGRQFVLEHCTTGHQFSAMLQVYREVLGQNRAFPASSRPN